MNDFEKLVLEMRKAQKNYFKTPHSDGVNKKKWLTESKLKESLVDNHLRGIQMPKMFSDGI